MAKVKNAGLPNVSTTHQRKRDGTPVLREIVAQAVPALAPVETMRVRFLRRITSKRHGAFDIGQCARLPVEQAKEWIGLGLVEQDKMLDSAPETKG